jgi:hypothetical protein
MNAVTCRSRCAKKAAVFEPHIVSGAVVVVPLLCSGCLLSLTQSIVTSRRCFTTLTRSRRSRRSGDCRYLSIFVE